MLHFHFKEYLRYILLQDDAVTRGRCAESRLKINGVHVQCMCAIKVDVTPSSETLLLPAKMHGVLSQKFTIWIYDFLRNIMWRNKCLLKRGTHHSSVNIVLFTNVFIGKAGLYILQKFLL